MDYTPLRRPASSPPRPAPRQPRTSLAQRARRLVQPLAAMMLGLQRPRPCEATLELPPIELLAGSHDPVDLPEPTTVPPPDLAASEQARVAVAPRRRVDVAAQERHRQAAQAARARLIASGHWRPLWDAEGLVDVFASLGDGPALDRLVAVLSRHPALVPLGPSPCAPTATDDPGTTFHGVPSTASLERHRRALALVASSPGLTYTEALRRVAP